MKRSILVVTLLALVLSAACATAPATPTLKGVVTKIEGNAVTVTPAAGDPAVVKYDYNTQIVWGNGTNADKTMISVGMPIQVYVNGNAQVAKRIVLAN